MNAMLRPGTDPTRPLMVVTRIQAQLLFSYRVDGNTGDLTISHRQLDRLTDLQAPQQQYRVLAVASN